MVAVANAHTAFPQRVLKAIAHVMIKAAQDLIPAIDQRGVDSQAGKDRRKLHSDIAAPFDQNRSGQLFEMEGFIRCDAQVAAFDVGLERSTAGGDQNPLGLQLLAG